MEADPNETRSAYVWLFAAGLAAVLLSVSLWKIDDYLVYSRGESVLGQTLRELRTAQASQEDRSTDEREFVPLIAEKK